MNDRLLYDDVAFREWVINSLIKLLRDEQAVVLELTFTSTSPIKFWGRGEKQMIISDIQSVVGTISPLDVDGNPTTLDAPPTWDSANPAIVALTVAPDGLSAVAKAVGPLGTSTITVSGMGGGKPLTATADIQVIASAATAMTINFGTPT